MKYFKITKIQALLGILAIGLITFGQVAKAQSGASSNSESNAGAAAGAQSGAVGILIQPGGGGGAGTTGASATGAGGQVGDRILSPQGVGVGIGGSSGASANNNGNRQAITFNSTTSRQYKNTPSVVNGSMTVLSNADSCLKGGQAGGSGAGFGLSFGKYTIDYNCDRRVNSAKLYNMGYRVASVQELCGIPSVWASFEISGTSPCLNGQPKSAKTLDTSARKPPVAKPVKPTKTAKKIKKQNSSLWGYPPRDDEDDFLY